MESAERYELRRKAGFKHKWEVLESDEKKKKSSLVQALQENRVLEIYPNKSVAKKFLPKAFVDNNIDVVTTK